MIGEGASTIRKLFKLQASLLQDPNKSSLCSPASTSPMEVVVALALLVTRGVVLPLRGKDRARSAGSFPGQVERVVHMRLDAGRMLRDRRKPVVARNQPPKTMRRTWSLRLPFHSNTPHATALARRRFNSWLSARASSNMTSSALTRSQMSPGWASTHGSSSMSKSHLPVRWKTW